MWRFKIGFLFFITVAWRNVESKVVEASDLDCNFEFSCNWFNGTSGLEDSDDWKTAQAVTLSAWNNLPILSIANDSAGLCLRNQLRQNKASKLAFSADCAESQSLTFMATTKSETDVYGYASGSSGSVAWLVSAEIPKQIGAGILTFAYWKSKNSPGLKVCGRKPPGYPNGIDCSWYASPQNFQGQQWTIDRVIIPPSDTSFEIIFVAQISDKNSLVAIDDIQYRASMGHEKSGDIQFSEGRASSTILSGATELRIPLLGDQPGGGGSSLPSDGNSHAAEMLRVVIDQTKCPLVACDFDKKSLCKYSNVAAGRWRQTKRRVGNRVTGIQRDQNGAGGFAYAQQDSKGNASFAMATRPFFTALPSMFTFAYHLTGRAGRLRVCDRSFDLCTTIVENTDSNTPGKLSGWEPFDLPLQSGTHQLIFVADEIPPNFVVGVDNAQLWDKTRSYELECFNA